MNTTALIRPAWTPATIALSVIGFMVFWPLGLAMIAYIIWGDRLDGLKRNFNPAMGAWKGSCRGKGSYRSRHARTGNVAFDDWRTKELERLAAERQKLEEMRDEFDDYARELRRAKDQDEFDRFMNARNAKGGESKPESGPTPGLLDGM